MEWMPLGVFALTAEGVNASSMYLQLAVSKEGVIAGTFYNESTGATHPVEGMVDEKTQRAVWKAADGTNANIVMETGLYNLTQDQAEVLVHFGPEKTQTRPVGPSGRSGATGGGGCTDFVGGSQSEPAGRRRSAITWLGQAQWDPSETRPRGSGPPIRRESFSDGSSLVTQDRCRQARDDAR